MSADIFRGRYRESLETAKPIASHQPLLYRFALPTANHVFLPGHRIMVQVQSSWFPLYDRRYSASPKWHWGDACYDPGVASVALTVEFTLRVVIYPAPDIEGQWIAHGLETDVVTQGDSPEHALAMMADALQALASHQALRRRPALQLRPAPTEIWDLAADAVPLDVTAHVDRRRRAAASPSAGPWGLYGLLSRKPPASRAR